MLATRIWFSTSSPACRVRLCASRKAAISTAEAAFATDLAQQTAADRYAPIDRTRMRALIGYPEGRALTKKAGQLGELEIRFIAHSPFMTHL
ncbi:hypothetical protein [Saccharopolyspora spinosa]|uniref:hypothetical protein n=1 Tax=Saccharopolyspora spinosa TaxID=60894 RepID=UPI0020122EBE|nr:hypothetical protein [Saccharopolyspora spinosa]